MASTDINLRVTMTDGTVHDVCCILADQTRLEREVGQGFAAMFGDKGLPSNGMAKLAWCAMRRLKIVERTLPFMSDDWDAVTFETMVASIGEIPATDNPLG